MKRVGISCGSLYHSKRDGIGIYSSELHSALLKKDTINLSIHKPSYQDMILSLLNLNTSYQNKKLDLIHITDYIIPKCKQIPLIATLHDAVPLQCPDWVNPRFRKLKNYILKKSVQSLTHAIVLCHAVIPEISCYWDIPAKDISVVYSGVSQKWFDPIQEANRKQVLDKYGITKKYMLFVGTLQPRKNICRSVQAYEMLPNDIKDEFQFILIGQSGWRNEEIFAHIDKLTRSGNGKWLNYVTTDDLHALYQAADFFVFPSLYEGFGLPILEAFASCLPVITSNVAAMPEISGDAALLVDPLSVEDITHAMRKLCEDANLKTLLQKKGLTRAKEFSWESCAQNTLNVYRKFIDF